MPSPFPGMDPYLEAEGLWPAFQHRLAACICQTLLPGLVDHYRARVCQRHYRTEQVLFTSIRREEHSEDYVEIRRRGNGRLVTVVEIASPVNKTTAEGRAAYLAKRREWRSQGASVAEIDLVLQGQPLLDYSRASVPDGCDYVVSVTRASRPDPFELYPATLRGRLQRFRLPLGSDESDTVFDLHTAFTRCYDQGGFAERIDYGGDPPPRLEDADRLWVRELLAKRRPE
jgi:hypothetical protein